MVTSRFTDIRAATIDMTRRVTTGCLRHQRVIALADSSILHTRHLGEAHNAGLALALAGTGRPVIFDEYAHGYGAGDRGLPPRWTRFLVAVTVAVLFWMWSEARRLGPPEVPSRPLPPARREYVDALAVSLSRTREPETAFAELQRAARRRMTTSLGLPVDASKAEMTAAARRAGMAEAEVEALFDPPITADEVLELGRVAAKHGGGRW